MDDFSSHYRKLENAYHNHPLNLFYGAKIEILDKQAIITLPIKRTFHHAANAVHGAVYWKLSEDSAFFAANSMVCDVFVLTANFTIYLTRPVLEGTLTAIGKLVNSTRSQFIAESILYNQDEEEIARGNGVYIKSKIKLTSEIGYC